MRLRIIAGCSRLCVHISSARNLSRNLQPLSEHYVGLFIHLTFLLRRLWDDLSGLSPLLDKLSLKCSVRWFQRAKSCRVIIYMIYSNRLTKKQNAANTCNRIAMVGSVEICVNVLRGGLHWVFWDSLAAKKRVSHCGLPDLLFVFLSFIPLRASVVNLNMQQDACLSFNSTSAAAQTKHLPIKGK